MPDPVAVNPTEEEVIEETTPTGSDEDPEEEEVEYVEESSGGSRLWMVASIVFFIGLVAAGVGLYQMWEKSETLRLAQIETAAEAQALREVRDALNADLEAAEMMLAQQEEAFGGQTENMQAEIADLKRRAAAAYNRGVRKGTKEGAAAARAELLAMAPAEDSLTTEIQQLAATVEQLRTENQGLQASVEVLRTEKIDLNTKIAGASALRVYALNARATEEKKGSFVPVEKAKKVDRLSVSMVVGENKVAKAGARLLHLVITDPDGQVLEGGGTFTTARGNEQAFSLTRNVNYQQTAETVELDWQADQKYDKGEYRFEVFLDGESAGSTRLVLQ
ncbi:MAG: hypothetical protein WBA12_16150 [Catalinimonas sp.]